MSKKKKSFSRDPLWVKAKALCRINQDDIAKAKELGISPQSLIKAIPSPQQQWKKPVKQWIRELHEQRFGRRTAPSAARKRAAPVVPRTPKPDIEDLDFPDDDDTEEFQAMAEEMLARIELEVPLQVDIDDPDWERLRVGRRQKNLCWAACSLTARLRDVPAVEIIRLFGSVAMSVRKPFGQPWTGPEAQAVCHTLNLAIWVTSADTATLCSLGLIVRQTLVSLIDVERIALDDERVEILLIEAGTNRLLGRLRRSAAATAAPSLEIPPEYVFRLKPLQEPQAVTLFTRVASRSPADSDGNVDSDIPF